MDSFGQCREIQRLGVGGGVEYSISSHLLRWGASLGPGFGAKLGLGKEVTAIFGWNITFKHR
jgi:hypothetical protein